jgi:hypothetical protein
MVPNYSWKIISGWINYSGMVISHKIRENGMEYRGSKSITGSIPTSLSEPVIVKEQRVYGSWPGNLYPGLRCTLTGFERNYQIKILYNQICFPLFRKFSLSTKSSLSSPTLCNISDKESIQNPVLEKSSCALEPWFITGFVDGEGSFMIRVRKNPKYRVGFSVEAYFSISLHKKDIRILQEIQSYFGVGKIRKDVKDLVKFVVESLKEIVDSIIPHFEKYPLITQKLADYLLFRDAVNLMINKEHLTKKGLNKIASIKAVINLGLPDELQLYFSDLMPVLRPLVENKTGTPAQWIAGFTSAEGCFKITLVKRPNRKIDQVYLAFQITQHSRDEKLLESFIAFFGCGILEASSSKPIVNFSVYTFSDNYGKIIPFFQKHNIFGVKSEDFQDWCKAAEIIKAKQHITEEGLNQIISLKSGINRKR